MPRKIEVEILGDSRDLERSLDRAKRSTNAFGKEMNKSSKFTSMLGKAAALTAGTAAIGAVTVALKSTIDAAKESQAAHARLVDALNNANISYKTHGKAIDDAIQKTSRLAALDDEDLSDAFSKLVRTTGNVTKATEGMNLVADIARARHISLEAATKIVERGLLGNANAFKKVGVEIGKNTTATEAFQKAQEQFAGSAESYGKTAAGAQERLSVAFENVKESIGLKLLPVVTKLLETLARVIEWTQANWPRIQQIFSQGADAVRAVIDRLRPVIENIVKIVKGVVDLISALVQGDWSRAWDAFKKIPEASVKAMLELLKLQIDLCLAVAKAIGTAILNGLKDGITGLVSVVEEKINAAITAIRGALKRGFDAASTLGERIVAGIKDGIADLVGSVANRVQAVVGAVASFAGRMFGAAKDLGEQFVAGLAHGLSGAAGAVAGGIADAVRAALNVLIDQINRAVEFSFHVPIVGTIHIDPPDIPHLAMGGIVTRPTLAVVGEAGPEAVVPLRGGTGSLGKTEIIINVAGSVVSEGQLVDAVHLGLLRKKRREIRLGLA